MSSPLLINESPLQVLPTLAVKIGLNESLILQQLQYWLNISGNYYDGKKWVYNSIAKWTEQFPFWSEKTITRIFKKLETQELVYVANYNKQKFDRTKWYSINYEKLNSLIENEIKTTESQLVQNHRDNFSVSHRDNLSVSHRDNLGVTIPETTQKNIQENNNTSGKPDEIPYKVIIDYLNEKASKHFKYTDSNKRLIKARWNEGQRLNDFKYVIDTMVTNWTGVFFGAKPAENFLQPKTLFGTKFDDYRNTPAQAPLKQQPQQGFARQPDYENSFRDMRAATPTSYVPAVEEIDPSLLPPY